jgi:tRNA 2-thiouridine synthesizing protein A
MPETLDTTGLFCPLPVLKTRRAIQSVEIGDTLTVRATDPASRIDMRHYCNTSGHAMVEAREENGVLIYVIRRTV